jgi:peptide deformylase
MAIVTDIERLRLPCSPVKNLREGGEVARKLQTELLKYNKKALKTYYKDGGKGTLQVGLGLAAPQIGIAKQVCVILVNNQPLALMNPRIVACSQETIPFTEGCLSLPGQKVETQRHIWVKVESLNLPPTVFGPTRPDEWNRFALLRSVVVQHEVAHTAGLLMTNFVNGGPHPTEWFR